MKKKHILGLSLVLININPKLTFDQSISSIDMTPSTPAIKTGFSKVP